MTAWIPGLAGVVAARTAVSRVDGETGRLWFRGRSVLEVGQLRFEDAAAVVLDRPLQGLGLARLEAWDAQRSLRAPVDPMAAVRARVAAGEWSTPEQAIAAVAVAVAFAARPDVPAPDPEASHAADLFRMVTGRVAGADEVRALGTYLATVMDHGLNASTFAARVVASTGSDEVSAVTAAIGALKGPLHGGAPGPVLDMLDAVGTVGNADSWVRAELLAGRRIMGMGHRVYRVRDPRAEVLEHAIGALHTDRLQLARAVEASAEARLAERHSDRTMRANVEFYTAILLEALGFSRDLFTPLFAAGRVVGWLAHIEEERHVGRILRPRAEYVGPACT